MGFRGAGNHRWAQLLCLFAVFLFLPFTVMCASLQTGKQGMGQKVKGGQISISTYRRDQLCFLTIIRKSCLQPAEAHLERQKGWGRVEGEEGKEKEGGVR